MRTVDKIRNAILVVLFTVSGVIFIISAVYKTTPFFADLLRPFVVINFFGAMRANVKEFWKDLKAALTILITVFAWIFIYAIVGFYMFRYSFEGTQDFVTFKEAYGSMLTLMTTANFPDVMLPSYRSNYFNVLYFASYLLIGLYFLLQLLLAVVFNKYKGRLEAKINRNEEKRKKQVEKLYKMFDTNKRGYLNFEEFRRFIAFVFDIRVTYGAGKE